MDETWEPWLIVLALSVLALQHFHASVSSSVRWYSELGDLRQLLVKNFCCIFQRKIGQGKRTKPSEDVSDVT